jgi:hypothetical protein
MEPFPDLPALQAVLEALAARDLVVYLSPPEQKRGVVVTHGLYPPQELEKVRQAYANSASAGGEPEERPVRQAAARSEPSPPAWATETAALRAQVEALRESLEALAAEVRDLKSALGA